MHDRDLATVNVTVTGLVPGDPPSLCFCERLRVIANVEKTFTQWLAVPDSGMFQRLQREVKPGDEIEITIATDWHDDGYETYLFDFFAPGEKSGIVERTHQRS